MEDVSLTTTPIPTAPTSRYPRRLRPPAPFLKAYGETVNERLNRRKITRNQGFISPAPRKKAAAGWTIPRSMPSP